MKAWHYMLFGLLSSLLAAGIILLVSSPVRGEPIQLPPAPTPAPITVDISGAVSQPGVYQLPVGSRVQDAIDAAGGLLENAYAETINLAMPLNDGTKVLIPVIPEPHTVAEGETNTNPASPASTLININTASSSQLQELPGIGQSKAQAIIDYRESYGPFTAVEQIMNVSGIGPATFERLKDLITIY
jgi:competence protein ComEA